MTQRELEAHILDRDYVWQYRHFALEELKRRHAAELEAAKAFHNVMKAERDYANGLLNRQQT